MCAHVCLLIRLIVVKFNYIHLRPYNYVGIVVDAKNTLDFSVPNCMTVLSYFLQKAIIKT